MFLLGGLGVLGFCFLGFFVLERERERERNINQFPLVRTLTGDLTCSLGMCPDQGWNPQPFGAQDDSPTN